MRAKVIIFSKKLHSTFVIHHFFCNFAPMIFFFTCTGNTRWAAETVAEAIGEKLVDMADKKNSNATFQLSEDERIGFCFPVHGWRPPQLVRSFVRSLTIKPANAGKPHFCWALCTAGDDIGLTMEYLDRDLSIIGLRTDSLFSLIMPESYVGLPFMDVDKPEKEKAKCEKAAQMLTGFTTDIRERRRDFISTYRGHWPRINSNLIGEAFVRWIITDKPFHVNSDCIGCGKCAEVCPVDNIISSKGKLPQWRHQGDCLSCFSCYHHCPTRAIRYGNRTERKGQYYFKK